MHLTEDCAIPTHQNQIKICVQLGFGQMPLEPQPWGPLAFGSGALVAPLLWPGVAVGRAGQPCAKFNFKPYVKKCMSQLIMLKINMSQLHNS